MVKKISATDKVDLFEEDIFTKHQISLSEEARDQVFWLYDNEVEFTFTVTKEGTPHLQLTDIEDVVGFKLRWD